MEKNYFLCSQAVVDFAKPTECSKPFKSGYAFDKDENYYVAIIDFDSVKKHYDELEVREYEPNSSTFWCQELVPGQMDVSEFTLKGIKMNGLFSEIEDVIGLTLDKNQAMTLHNLSERFNCTPIEFINKSAAKFK